MKGHEGKPPAGERFFRPLLDGVPEERAVLVGVHLPERFDGGLGGRADTTELGQLVRTAGGRVVRTLHQALTRPNARTFLGKGKLEEVVEEVNCHQANLVVFDNELSPAQGRNLEKALDVNVIDRTELILDIFARHARTRQARLQVELAQLQYLLPRLTRLWSHLERQAGGIGTRGPGETQLETDRRLIGRRITNLKQALHTIATGRNVQRGRRAELFQAVLIGYTNAGKSTLMNGITDAGVIVKDRLFATLDATTRRVELDERHQFLLTDTVGFIRRLPHHLVESFRATLQEVTDANLLVHVVDASSADPELQIASVNRVLAELISGEKPTMLVFNKMDRVDPELFRNRFERFYPEALFVSALRADGFANLRDGVMARLRKTEEVFHLQLPAERRDCLAVYHRTGSVLHEQDNGSTYQVTVRMRPGELQRLLARVPEARLLQKHHRPS